jgi:spore coat polysaccharide biosynthesis predicted glycosyltransferase SpsG
MQHYKNYSIFTTAVSADGGVWHGRGVVLNAEAKLAREIHRTETAEDLVFLTKQDAEDFALKLCRAWIDRAALYKVM